MTDMLKIRVTLQGVTDLMTFNLTRALARAVCSAQATALLGSGPSPHTTAKRYPAAPGTPWLWLSVLLATLLILTPPVQAQTPPTVTLLKWHESIHFRADGSNVVELQTVTRIDSEAAIESYAEDRTEFSESRESVQVLEAWTQTPDGKRHEVAPDRIRTLLASDQGLADFTDAKVKVVIFPSVVVGATLHLRLRITAHTPLYPGHALWNRFFPPDMLAEDVRIDISHDPAVPLRVQARASTVDPTLRATGGRVEAREGDAPGTVRYAFTYRQDDAADGERMRVSYIDYAPHVGATTFADYAALAAAYQARARPHAEPTAAIRKLADELTAGATTERDKLQRLVHWVSRHIRYVFMDLGTGGVVPHPADDVLKHRYGDCKDHVVQLEALLRAAGIESTPALINSGRAMKLPDLPLSIPFNHVITYIPSLGLFLDPTARFAPLGTLHREVMDKPVLLTASGRMARTPRARPDHDHTRVSVAMELKPSGEVTGTSVATPRGLEEVASRSVQFNNLETPDDELARRYLGRFGETGTGRIEVGDPLDLDAPWEVHATFELDPVVNIPGPSAMTIPMGLAPGNIRRLATSRPISRPTSQRRFPYVCMPLRHTEVVELKLPPSVRIERIPKGVRFERGPLRYRASYQLQGRSLKVERELTADRASHTCTARDDEDWSALLRVLQRDLRGQVFLR